MVQSPELRKTDLSSLQAVSSGAAYLPPHLSGKFSENVSRTNKTGSNKIVMTEGYGMSEGTLSAISKGIEGILQGRVKDKTGSTGVLLPGVEARIVRDDGSDADINETGELWLRGGFVALGYWNNEKATNETFVEGGQWLRTGDNFRVDQDGIFLFVLLSTHFPSFGSSRIFFQFRRQGERHTQNFGHASLTSGD